MKILFIGDIDDVAGREAVTSILPQLKSDRQIDIVIANAENLDGLGARKSHIIAMQKAGVDIFTSGNHIWNKEEINSLLEQKDSPLLRPANYASTFPGVGARIFVLSTGKKMLVINLIGRTFMSRSPDNPFFKFDEILKEFASEQPEIIFIDLHAEATSEKRALGFYVDGQATVMVGTHTHVPTADAQILPKGTAYITDVGMVGAKNSVLGVKKDMVIDFFKTEASIESVKWESATGPVEFSAVLIDIDDQTDKAKSIELIQR